MRQDHLRFDTLRKKPACLTGRFGKSYSVALSGLVCHRATRRASGRRRGIGVQRERHALQYNSIAEGSMLSISLRQSVDARLLSRSLFSRMSYGPQHSHSPRAEVSMHLHIGQPSLRRSIGRPINPCPHPSHRTTTSPHQSRTCTTTGPRAWALQFATALAHQPLSLPNCLPCPRKRRRQTRPWRR